MRSLARTIALVAVVAANASVAEAQSANHVFLQPYFAYNVDGSEALFGGAVGIPIRVGTSQILLAPGFEIYPFLDNASLYSVNFDVHYQFILPSSPVRPYIGGGLLLARASIDVLGTTVTDTNSPINALGGVDFGLGQVSPFVEADLRFIDGSSLVLKGGGRISLGK
jgi:hypothetical protein